MPRPDLTGPIVLTSLVVRRWTTFGPPPEPRGGERQGLRGETPQSEGGIRTLGTAADLLDGAFRINGIPSQ